MQTSHYQKSILSNGITVISEHIPSIRSVSVGVWLKTGTRFEVAAQNGLAHFLEHILFKGTESRSSLDIARHLESVGGSLNAFTSKEITCFYAEALGEHLERAIDILSDILLHSTFDASEIEKERCVILDEIQSSLDIPEDLVQETLSERLFADSALALPILGTQHTVREINRDMLIDFHQKYYVSGNMVIAAAGNLSHSQLTDLVQKSFDVPEKAVKLSVVPPQKYGFGTFELKQPANQSHVCIGCPSLPYNDERRYTLLVLNTLLGGGMSSRLFQNIREKYGIAYSIYSFLDFYYDTGLLGVYFGTDMKNYPKIIGLVKEEFEKVRNSFISYDELEDAKAQLRGGLILSLESSVRRMTRLAKSEIYFKEFLEIDAVVKKIESICKEELIKLADTLLNPERSMQVILVPSE